jgi:adenine nucleotide transporter 17
MHKRDAVIYGLQTDGVVCAGIPGFYDGMRTKIIQTVLAAAIMFYIREKAYKATKAAIGQASPLQRVLAVA